MKKALLFATALCLAGSAMAQTDIQTAIPAEEGVNNYKVEGQDYQTIYWKWTATKNCLATVNPLSGSSIAPTVSVFDAAGNETVLAGAQMKYPTKAYAFLEGETYYFQMNAYGESGFNLAIEDIEGLGAGLDENHPMEIKLGAQQYFGDPKKSSSSYGESTFYASFTAEKNGQLRLALSGYISSAIVGDAAAEVEYDTASGKYLVKAGVKAGNTYKIILKASNSTVGTSEIVDVVEGSLDAPFAMKDGLNTVPAAKGDYYFTYTPGTSGFLNISSDAVIAGGQVKVYGSKSELSYGYTPKGTSEPGTFNLKMDVPYAPSTPYLIVVSKLEDTQEAQNFNVEMKAYAPGETLANAIMLENLPVEEVLPEAKGTYYYKLQVPANTGKYLVVETKEDLDAATSIMFYPEYSESEAVTLQNGKLKTLLNSSYDRNYYLKVVSNEAEPLKFKASYENLSQGSLNTNPIPAVEGENNVALDGTVYYSYTATKDGKLVVEVEPGVSVSFQKPAGEYGYYTTLRNGIQFAVEAQAGTTYLIELTNAIANTNFYLEETDFSKGEVRTNPIEMEEDTYSFTNAGASNLWLLYNVTKDGVLDFSCDVPYNGGSDYIEILKNDTPYGTRMMGNETVGSETTTVYKGKMSVMKGDKLYIHCVLSGTVTGGKVKFVEHVALQGETLANPLVLEKGQSVTITEPSFDAPIWVKVMLPAGETALHFTDNVSGTIYTSEEDAKNDLNGRDVYSQMLYGENYVPVTDENGAPIYEWKQTMEEAGVAYFKFVRGSSSVKMTYPDASTGIANIEAIADGKVSVFKMDGTQVNEISGNGVYIIKSNGKTKKVVIRK